MRRWGWTGACLWVVGLCACAGGSVQPIVIDLSHPTPTPTAAGPQPAAAPAPTPAPPPPAGSPAPSPSPDRAPAPTAASPAEPTKAEGVLDAQRAAYNRHELEGFLRFFAPDAVLSEFPDGPRQSGVGEIRARYAREFSESPTATATLVRRIVQGDFVIEQCDMAGLAGRGISSLTTISEVRAGRIQRVWFVR